MSGQIGENILGILIRLRFDSSRSEKKREYGVLSISMKMRGIYGMPYAGRQEITYVLVINRSKTISFMIFRKIDAEKFRNENSNVHIFHLIGSNANSIIILKYE